MRKRRDLKLTVSVHLAATSLHFVRKDSSQGLQIPLLPFYKTDHKGRCCKTDAEAERFELSKAFTPWRFSKPLH